MKHSRDWRPGPKLAALAAFCVDRYGPGFLFLLGTCAAVAAIAVVTYVGVQLAGSDLANIRGDEPYFVSGVVRILAGNPLYTNPSDTPFCLTGYTPAAYYAAAWAAVLSGVDSRDLPGVMRAARTASLALTMLHFLLMLVILRRWFRSPWLIALLGCAVVYAIRSPWGFIVRPDPLYSLLFLASVSFNIADYSRTGNRFGAMAFLAGIFAGLTYLTKQTGIQLPIFLLSFYLFALDSRRFATYLLGCLLPIAAILILVSLTSGPNWISGALLLAHGGVRSVDSLGDLLKHVLIEEGGAVLIATAIPAWISWMRPGAPTRNRLLAWIAVGSLAFSFITIVSSGSAEHYFNDSLMLAAMCAAVYWGSREPGDNKDAAYCLRRDCVVVVYCAIFLLLFVSTWVIDYPQGDDRIGQRMRIRSEMERRLNEHPESFFLTVDNTLANFFPNRAVVPQMHYAAIFQRGGGIDLAKLQASLDSGRVRWCLMGAEQDLSHQLGHLKLVAPKFARETVVDGFSIWEFRD